MTNHFVIIMIILTMIFFESIPRVCELAAVIGTKTRRAIQLCLKPFGITVDQFGTLLVLLHAQGISQRELAAALETDTTTAMVICDGLEKRGLATRRRDSEDRRSNLLSITPKGQRLVAKASIAVERFASPLMSVLTTEEVDRITPALERLAARANQLQQQASLPARKRRIP